jgi:GEVED domain-containing protein/type IX secretion system substrate protein
MRNSLLIKFTHFIVLAVVVLLAIPSNKANAQYCGFNHVQYWNQYGIINSVTVRDVTEGTIVLQRLNTGWERWASVDRTGGPYDFNIGNNFEILVNWGLYYNGYLRVYLDKNDDKRWDQSPIGPDFEFIAKLYAAPGFIFPASPTMNNTIPFKVGDNVPEGPSVLRLIANYNWNSNDPCTLYFNSTYQWGYGEVEDYNINFVAPVPETYPTTGNILFNNQRYDGTTRMFNGQMTDFRLPAAESKGPQPTGTLLEYWITGPLPSTQVVYRALDPNTGSQSIRYTSPTQIYTMRSATGPASVSTSEGTFKPSKGGEYKVNVKLTKLSGKSAQGVKVFTVANNYDMSVASIESPRTSRFPRFFKYLRLTNIKVAALIQNTGLNPVKRFEVTAKIYNANTNALVSTQPKIVFDSDNDPNLLPLQSGQKFEANFAAFQTAFTGEYYVQFEVFYTFDEEKYNNTLPRPDGEKHYFEVQYNDQLTAGEFEAPTPGQVLKVNRPNSPVIEFFNNGISDASNINFHMVVKNSAGQEVYNEVSFLEDMPQGRYNSKLVTFPNMIIREPGTYTACAWVDYPYDSKHDDDTTCVTFEVELGIQDTITVGDLGGIVNQTSNDGELNSANEENKTQRIESSVVDFNFNGFSVNPASTTTAIRFNSEAALTLEVVDMNGNVVFSDTAKNNLYNLDVTNLANGAYTVLLRSANGIQSRQLSVVR